MPIGRLHSNSKFNKVNLTTESIWIEKIHPDAKRNFIVGVVYRHPGSTIECLEEFTKQLNTIISKIEKENKKVFIIGDLNIDGMRVAENKHVEKFFHMLMDNNYLPLITKPTRVQDTSISIIDHVIINDKVIKTDTKIKSGVLYSSITDHLPVFISIQEEHKITPKVRPMIRVYNEKNKNLFLRLIKNCNWETFAQATHVNHALGIFYKNWKKCHTKAFPLVKLSRTKIKHKPWISSELIKEIRQKNKLYKRCMENPTKENKLKLRNLSNKVTNKIRKEQGIYYLNIINSEKKTLKTLWNLFGKVMNTKKNREKPKIQELKVKNKSITDDKEIADTINNYFANIGKNLADKHDKDFNKFKDYLEPAVKESIDLTPTRPLEVLLTISSLKKKGSGADEVHPRLLAHCKKVISPILAHLYNLCFQQTDYPDLLKIAKVIPLFKKTLEEEKLDPGNYRPISLLSAINKILEKIIYSRLITFINKHNILYKYQFGFRKIHSTTLALMDVVDKIRHNLAIGKKVAGVYIDFSKAFDTVNHQILLYKLQHLGIRGSMLQLIKSYLNNRKQFTCVNGTESKKQKVECGVPQGSVLGPLLFLLYTNDIGNCTDEEIKLFADDTNGFIFEENYSILKTKIKTLLLKLFDWAAANKLTINISKTCYTIFTKVNCKVPPSLNSVKLVPKQDDKQNSIVIKREKQSKYLGVFLDELLSWDYHLNDTEDGLLAKLTKINNSFKIIKHCVPERTKFILFNAYFASKISYGIELFGSADKALMHKLQVKQNRALKILFDKEFLTPTKKLHYDLKILMVEDIYKMSLAKFVYKQQNKRLPSIFENHYTRINETHEHETRRHNELKIENAPNKSKHNELLSKVTGAKIYNALPEEIRDARKFEDFKNYCKVFYINNYDQTNVTN